MSLARVISRGAFLKARFGVNGIQNASRSLGRASAERRASERDIGALRAGGGNARWFGTTNLVRRCQDSKSDVSLLPCLTRHCTSKCSPDQAIRKYSENNSEFFVSGRFGAGRRIDSRSNASALRAIPCRGRTRKMVRRNSELVE